MTPLQRQALALLNEWAAAGQVPTQREIARLLKCREATVSEWNVDARWREALTASYRESAGVIWARAEVNAATRASRGSDRAFEFYVTNGGPVSWAPQGVLRPDSGDGAGAIGGVHVHVHGIPERQPMTALPPPMTIPATASAPAHPPTK